LAAKGLEMKTEMKNKGDSMNEIEINGQKMTNTEASAWLNKEPTVVHTLAFDIPSNKKPKKTAPHSGGFDIPKENISELCRNMDKMNASLVKLTLAGAPSILNRDLILIIKRPDAELNWIKQYLVKLILKWI